MPLNIDWQQILLHAFNFIILAAGLTFLLFKPVKKFMAAREESYKKAAEEHRQKLDELESLEKERQAKIAALDGELAEPVEPLDALVVGGVDLFCYSNHDQENREVRLEMMRLLEEDPGAGKR